MIDLVLCSDIVKHFVCLSVKYMTETTLRSEDNKGYLA